MTQFLRRTHRVLLYGVNALTRSHWNYRPAVCDLSAEILRHIASKQKGSARTVILSFRFLSTRQEVNSQLLVHVMLAIPSHLQLQQVWDNFAFLCKSNKQSSPPLENTASNSESGDRIMTTVLCWNHRNKSGNHHQSGHDIQFQFG